MKVKSAADLLLYITILYVKGRMAGMSAAGRTRDFNAEEFSCRHSNHVFLFVSATLSVWRNSNQTASCAATKPKHNVTKRFEQNAHSEPGAECEFPSSSFFIVIPVFADMSFYA